MAAPSLAVRRSGAALRPHTRGASVMSRRALVIRNFKEGEQNSKTKVQERDINTNSVPDDAARTRWIPGVEPLVELVAAEDRMMGGAGESQKDRDPYNPNVKPQAEESFGWNRLPEAINGRAAMIGFVAATGYELVGRGTFFDQVGIAPITVASTIGIIALASVIPALRRASDSQTRDLRQQVGIPEGLFTWANEKFHGRVAMLALVTLVGIEYVTGRSFYPTVFPQADGQSINRTIDSAKGAAKGAARDAKGAANRIFDTAALPEFFGSRSADKAASKGPSGAESIPASQKADVGLPGQGLFNAAKDAVQSVTDKGSDAIQSGSDTISNVNKGLANKDFGQDAKDKIKAASQDLNDRLPGGGLFNKGKDAAQDAGNAAKDIADRVTLKVRDAGSS